VSTKLHSNLSYQMALQIQFNTQIRPTSVTQQYLCTSTSTSLFSPNNYLLTENSSDRFIQIKSIKILIE